MLDVEVKLVYLDYLYFSDKFKIRVFKFIFFSQKSTL